MVLSPRADAPGVEEQTLPGLQARLLALHRHAGSVAPERVLSRGEGTALPAPTDSERAF